MAHERLVAVSYPVDGEFTSINADVLGDLATLSYTEGCPRTSGRTCCARPRC